MTLDGEPLEPPDTTLQVLRGLNQVGVDDYCIEGPDHAWNTPGWECECRDGNCCLECSDCGAIDCYCEDA